MRILHLIEPGLCGTNRGVGACALRMIVELIRRQPSVRHEVLIIGNGHEVQVARRCGIQPLGHLCLPRLRPMSAKAALTARLRPMEFSGDPFTVLHAWSPRAAMLAALSAAHRPRMATILDAPAASRESRLFAALMNRLPTALLVAGNDIRQAWSAAGVPSMTMTVAPPGVVCEPLDSSARQTIRATWNEQADITQDTIIIGVMADQPLAVAAPLAFEIIGRLALGGRDVRMVMHPQANHRADMERSARRLGLEGILIQDAAIAEPWRVLPGLDAALAMADASRLSSLWACAAGVPCAVEQSAWVDGLQRDAQARLSSEHRFFEFPKRSVNDATELLARWCDDPGESRAAAEASSRFALQAFDFEAFVDHFDQGCDDALNQRGLRRATGSPAIV